MYMCLYLYEWRKGSHLYFTHTQRLGSESQGGKRHNARHRGASYNHHIYVRARSWPRWVPYKGIIVLNRELANMPNVSRSDVRGIAKCPIERQRKERIGRRSAKLANSYGLGLPSGREREPSERRHLPSFWWECARGRARLFAKGSPLARVLEGWWIIYMWGLHNWFLPWVQISS